MVNGFFVLVSSDTFKGRRNIKTFWLHPKPPHFGPPACLISWERTQKMGPTWTFLGGILGVKNGVPDGPFSATRSWVDCFSLPLIPSWTMRIHAWPIFSQIDNCKKYMLATCRKLFESIFHGSYMRIIPQHVSGHVRARCMKFLGINCQRVHSILENSSSVGVLPAALKAGASLPIPLALSCHWDGGGVGTLNVSKGWEGFVPSWFKSTSSQHVEFGGRVGIRKGSEEIAALACAGRVKATIFLNINKCKIYMLVTCRKCFRIHLTIQNLMYIKRGVAYKLHAGWFINRPPAEFINWFFIKFKGLLCGKPTERGESLILNLWPPGSL